ncbi:hypothetical protein BJX70DRAFT_398252 [Aspergillus crustosus]
MAPEPSATIFSINPSPSAENPSDHDCYDYNQERDAGQDRYEDEEEDELSNDHSNFNPNSTSTTSSKPSKPRPITSCAPCRIRKVKCNRASPCTSCITRQTVSECTYATTPAERSAISQAETIAELRATRNRLQAQLARNNANPSLSLSSSLQRGEEAEENELAALEAVYAVLRAGSWDLAREFVGRMRGGEEVGDLLGGVKGG